MYKRIFTLLLSIVLLTSCSSAPVEEVPEDSESSLESSTISEPEFDRENTLEVFMVGAPVSWGDEGDFNTTMYQIGDLPTNFHTWGEKGHIYYTALNDYQKQSTLDVSLPSRACTPWKMIPASALRTARRSPCPTAGTAFT